MNEYSKIPEILERYRIPHPITGEKGDSFCGWFKIVIKTQKKEQLIATVCYAAGMGWEHVSVSLNKKRCPTWDEMCKIKEMFWGSSKTVIQYHPSKNKYVNNHPYCLHLWRCIDSEIPYPSIEMI